jgi:hypothetical protein
LLEENEKKKAEVSLRGATQREVKAAAAAAARASSVSRVVTCHVAARIIIT